MTKMQPSGFGKRWTALDFGRQKGGLRSILPKKGWTALDARVDCVRSIFTRNTICRKGLRVFCSAIVEELIEDISIGRRLNKRRRAPRGFGYALVSRLISELS